MRSLALFLLLGLAGVAQAHDKWWDGREVDPSTKRFCCGDNDIKHLTREQVKVVPGGYRLEDTGEIVPHDRTQPSPDGEYWVFRWGSPMQTQCFFAPIQSM
jgi:hypothetical protein